MIFKQLDHQSHMWFFLTLLEEISDQGWNVWVMNCLNCLIPFIHYNILNVTSYIECTIVNGALRALVLNRPLVKWFIGKGYNIMFGSKLILAS